MIATQLCETAIVVEYLRIFLKILPWQLVDVVGRLETVVYSLLVAKHLFSGKDEWHTLGGEDCCLCEKIKTDKFFLGDARDACLETVNKTHVVVATHVGYHLCRGVGPCSLTVVHLAHVNLRMGDTSGNTESYALLIAGDGTEECRLMIVAKRTADGITHIVAEGTNTV